MGEIGVSVFLVIFTGTFVPLTLLLLGSVTLLCRKINAVSNLEKKLQLAASGERKQKILAKKLTHDIDLLGHSWRIEECELEIKEIIASKSKSDQVLRATLRGKWEVAMKKTKTSEKQAQVENEITFFTHARSPNLVLFLGYVQTKKDRFIVMEYMEGGDLSKHIWGKKQTEVTWAFRLTILREVCLGLQYLHMIQSALHRDLKSPNILLGEPDSSGMRHAKLSDFGCSRIVSSGKTKVRQKNLAESTRRESLEPYINKEEESAARSLLWEKRLVGGWIGTVQWMGT